MMTCSPTNVKFQASTLVFGGAEAKPQHSHRWDNLEGHLGW